MLEHESSTKNIYESRTGKSNVDLTLVTNNLVRIITDWEIKDEESNSDHSILTYDMISEINYKNNTNATEI